MKPILRFRNEKTVIGDSGIKMLILNIFDC